MSLVVHVRAHLTVDQDIARLLDRMHPRATLHLPSGKLLHLYPDGDLALDETVVEDPSLLSDRDQDEISRAISEYVAQMHPAP